MMNERKLRESAATMAQMRGRMRAMGMNEEVPSSVSVSSSVRTSTAGSITMTALPGSDMLMPPPPPSREIERVVHVSPAAKSTEHDMKVIGDDEESLYKTPSDSDGDEDVQQSSIRRSTQKNLTGSQVTATTMLEIEGLRNKTKQYQRVLR